MPRSLALSTVLVGSLLGCSDPLPLGNDLIWVADQETGTLEQWTRDGQGDVSEPTPPDGKDASSIRATTDIAHTGLYAVKLVNPTGWDQDDEGPQLYHAVAEADGYYSAWFFLPEDYRIDPHLTLLRLRSRDPESGQVSNGEELQLRSVSSGGYVLQVFNNNSNNLRSPIADPPPLVQAKRWFQLEARYEPQSSGRLRVWLDGVLFYDLRDRPEATGAEIAFTVCNVAQSAQPAPLVLFVDDAAISVSRVSPTGRL
jgi:hypothetical protein